MGQELARPVGIMVCMSAECIGRDMRSDKPEFVVVDAHVCFGNRHMPGAERFDLSAREDDAGFDRVENVIVVQRPPVGNHDTVGAPIVFR